MDELREERIGACPGRGLGQIWSRLPHGTSDRVDGRLEELPQEELRRQTGLEDLPREQPEEAQGRVAVLVMGQEGSADGPECPFRARAGDASRVPGCRQDRLGDQRRATREDLRVEPFLGPEVIVDRAQVCPCLVGDLTDGRAGEPVPGEQPLSGVEDPFAGAGRRRGSRHVHMIVSYTRMNAARKAPFRLCLRCCQDGEVEIDAAQWSPGVRDRNAESPGLSAAVRVVGMNRASAPHPSAADAPSWPSRCTNR